MIKGWNMRLKIAAALLIGSTIILPNASFAQKPDKEFAKEQKEQDKEFRQWLKSQGKEEKDWAKATEKERKEYEKYLKKTQKNEKY